MIEIFGQPLPPAPLPAEAQAPTQAPRLGPQGDEETIPDYRARALRHALQWGPWGLDLEQLRAMDAGAAWMIRTLPARLDQEPPHMRALDDRIHDLRLYAARRLDAHRAAWGAICAQLTQGQDDEQPPDQDAPQGPEAPPETETERAARLLRAGLVALMQGLDDPRDGGMHARLKHPIGPIAPSGDALKQPTTPPATKGGRF